MSDVPKIINDIDGSTGSGVGTCETQENDIKNVVDCSGKDDNEYEGFQNNE